MSTVNSESGIEPIMFRGRRMKKTYERPAIIHTEKLEARAVMCAKAGNNETCNAGPIQS